MSDSHVKISVIEQELLNSISIEKARCHNLLAENSSNVHIQKISKLILSYLDSIEQEVKVVCEMKPSEPNNPCVEGRFRANRNLDKKHNEIEALLQLITPLN